MSLLSNYDSLWKAFVRPYRQTYHEYDLGPSTFLLASTSIRRTDLILKNKRGLPLKCSHYEPYNIKLKQTESAPCVIYLHCNTGCRLEAKPAVDLLLPLGISVFCFDFTGCGLSGGEYITLGWFEKDDLDVVIRHLRNNQKVMKLALWGRSMGAVTAILYSEKDQNIAGLVLDSPFSNLTKLAEDVAISKTKLPSLVIKGALALIKQTIFKSTKLNMSNLSLEKLVERVTVPALFAASKDDTFVKFWHVETLFKGYKGDKRLVHISGDHNEVRESQFMEEVGDYLQRILQVKKKNKEILEVDKENSPYISNTIGSSTINNIPNNVPNLLIANKNNEGHKVIPLAKIDLSTEEASNFMESFSQSLKNISEKDFLHFFTTKPDESLIIGSTTEDTNLRSRAITHDGKLESKEVIPKGHLTLLQEDSQVFIDSPSKIPNERAERSISALNDYSMFYAKPGMSGLEKGGFNDIETYFSSNKGNNNNEATTDGSNTNTGLKNASIDESTLEDEGSPGLEKKYRMMKVATHRDVVKSFNFDKGNVLGEIKGNVGKSMNSINLGKKNMGKNVKSKAVGMKPGFKPGFTEKLKNMKIVTSQIKEIGE